jgi:hypothetical protein
LLCSFCAATAIHKVHTALGFRTAEQLNAAAYYDADAATYAAAAAADAYAYAYAYAAADAAKKQNQQLTADICRKYLPIEIWNFK